MKKYSEVKNTKEVLDAQTSSFKEVQKGFPEGEMGVVVVGQDADFSFTNQQGAQSVGMVKVLVVGKDVTELTDDTEVSINRCVQASLAKAIGCFTPEEWAAARDAKQVFQIKATRRQPATVEEIQRGKGKMIFERR